MINQILGHPVWSVIMMIYCIDLEKLSKSLLLTIMINKNRTILMILMLKMLRRYCPVIYIKLNWVLLRRKRKVINKLKNGIKIH